MKPVDVNRAAFLLKKKSRAEELRSVLQHAKSEVTVRMMLGELQDDPEKIDCELHPPLEIFMTLAESGEFLLKYLDAEVDQCANDLRQLGVEIHG